MAEVPARVRRRLIPQVINIADLQTTPRKPTLIHFTDEQWRNATRDAEETRAVKRGHPFIEYTPLPDGGGIILADCGSPSPDEICSVRPIFDPPPPPPGPGPGPRPGPEAFPGPEPIPGRGQLRWECRCRSRRQPRGPGVIVRPPCELVISLTSRPIIRCANNSCRQTCHLRAVRDGFRIRLFCECS